MGTGLMLFQHTTDSVLNILKYTICCCFCGAWNDMRSVPINAEY